MKWLAKVLVVILLVMTVLSACTDNSNNNSNQDDPPANMKNDEMAKEGGSDEEKVVMEVTLSLEELKAYNGQNGMPAYVAVDGIIYDVTESSYWKEGQHNGYQAGQDLTDIIKNVSPHGIKKLERVEQVGILIDDDSSNPSDTTTSENEGVETTEEESIEEESEATESQTESDVTEEEASEVVVEEETETEESEVNEEESTQEETTETEMTDTEANETETNETESNEGNETETTETETSGETEAPYNGILNIKEEDIGDVRLTLAELSSYNGMNGMPAYIAVDGIIFDLSKIGHWSGGTHNGFEAGKDHTQNMINAPHGYTKLKLVPAVGKIID